MTTIQADLASTRATLSAVNAQLATAMAERDQASSESVEHGRQRDAVDEELRDVRDQLIRSQRETESARQFDPTHGDVYHRGRGRVLPDCGDPVSVAFGPLAEAYWEGTHELLIPANATWNSWRR
ncbi:hypothetical protein ON010_g18423 [Phytophthora cinnamomi]|nr:hypothetical protein ON010_g18423 [Phytophthora cinnamomi]